MSAPPGRGEAFWRYVMDAVAHLDERSYYQLLGVAESADVDTISRAYYELASRLHPDRHIRESGERQRALTRLYARVGEAYRKLRSSDTRRAYDAILEGGVNRLSRDAEERARRRGRAQDPRTPKARALYTRGRELLDRGDRRGANAQWRLAVQFEPDSQVIRAALAELNGAPAGGRDDHLKRDAGRAVGDEAVGARTTRTDTATDPPRRPLDLAALARRVRDMGGDDGTCDELASALEAAPEDRRLRALWHASLAVLARVQGRSREAALHRQTALLLDPHCPVYKRES